jgi:tetratricopeptide (TPR) repeat protein
MDSLSLGLQLANQAVAADSQGQLKSYELYDRAIECFNKAIGETNDPQHRELISQKTQEYRLRSQTLKNLYIAQQLPSLKSATTLQSQQARQSSPAVAAAEFPAIPSQPVSSSSSSSSSSFQLPAFPAASVMNGSEALLAANDLASIGKREDEARRFENALSAYKASLDYFMRAVNREPSDAARHSIGQTMQQYLSRAEHLQHLVSTMRSQDVGNTALVCGLPGCGKPIAYGENYKMIGGAPYHVGCFDAATGESRREQETFS